MKRLILLIPFLFFFSNSHAQNNDDVIQNILDDWIQTQDEQTDYEALLEQLYLLANEPIDINKASAEELRSIFLLKEKEIDELLTYRESVGVISDLYELQAIENWNIELIEKILPFISIETNIYQSKLFKRIYKEGKGYFLMRTDFILEKKKGFSIQDENQKFEGENVRNLIRFKKSQLGDYSIGFTLEHDAGEKWNWNLSKNKVGFDYNNFHFQIQNKKFIKNIIIGDFQLQSGQGLLHGNAFGLGKGGETINTIRRNNTLFKPFTSTLENAGLRGLALTFSLNKKVNLSFYQSLKNRNATSKNDSLGNVFISSWRNSGLHRNINERNDENTVLEIANGAIIQFENNTTILGLQFQHVLFNKDIIPKPNLYNQFAFKGKKYEALSAYFSKSIGAFHFFGEQAMYKKYFAANLGFIAALDNRTDWLLHYRYYDKQFTSLTSNAFAESSTGQNEIGIYTGIKHQIRKKHIWSAYIDFYQFPWLRFRLYQPATGWDALFRYQLSPSKKTNFIFQYRIEEKPRNSSTENINYLIEIIKKQQLIFSLQHQASENWRFQTRIQYSKIYNGDKNEGIALAQDVGYKFKNFTFNYRYALFDISDFDARQYIAERDVWSAVSLPMLNGTGSRTYFLVQMKYNKIISFWIRYAHTFLKNTDEIGSGLDATQGNTRNEIKFQVMINL